MKYPTSHLVFSRFTHESLDDDFVGDFARLLILGANCSHAVHNLIRVNSRIHMCPQNGTYVAKEVPCPQGTLLFLAVESNNP